jgi:hypothetical protein
MLQSLGIFWRKQEKRIRVKRKVGSFKADFRMSSVPPEIYIRKNLIVELQELYIDEDLQWFNISHEKWLVQGDQKISFFHRGPNGIKRKNTMLTLKMSVFVLKGLIIG